MGVTTPPVQIEITRLPEAAELPLPSRATPGAAGYDLCAAVRQDLVLAPGDRTLVPTGFCFAIPAGYEGQVRPRSGLALRHGILLPNAPGTIDSDYRGEVRVLLINLGSEPFTIRRGDRIAQLIVNEVLRATWKPAESLEETGRNHGGFGHTGT